MFTRSCKILSKFAIAFVATENLFDYLLLKVYSELEKIQMFSTQQCVVFTVFTFQWSQHVADSNVMQFFSRWGYWRIFRLFTFHGIVNVCFHGVWKWAKWVNFRISPGKHLTKLESALVWINFHQNCYVVKWTPHLIVSRVDKTI